MRAQHPRASWLNPQTGKLLDRNALMQTMATQQVVLLGERHDIAEIHRWQLHVIAALHTLHPNIAVGFEMFPRRLQSVLDEWVSGALRTEDFIEKSEWYQAWGFPAEIYLPIFHFCRQNNIRMLALNCYRDLVRRVGKDGWESVPQEERDGLTPAAPASDAYVAHLTSLVKRNGIPSQGMEHFVRAQQTWDRAFACNIDAAIKIAAMENKEPLLVVGVIGRGHVERGHGTAHQLKDLGIHNIGSYVTTEMSEHELEEIQGLADGIFRIDVPEDAATRVTSKTAVEK